MKTRKRMMIQRLRFEWVAPRIQASMTYYLNKYPTE
jgi:hypothetical protein